MSFFPEVDLTAVEAEAFARGLYAVARVDGVHEREYALISEFYGAAVAEDSRGSSTVASLERSGALEPNEVAAVVLAPEKRELFLKTAILLSWADGSVSEGERAKIAEFAKALQIASEVQQRLEAEVKDFLLRPLAGLANVAAVSAVARKLGM